ncbi:MAG: hypothetical protein HC929_15315 [Leptolyngbyaceae cyanobacterium SM2_5_2]|nr:hypothetical protein [Leptolyngbyaceae cyanobacterium SM2_5_2]
MVTRSTVNSGRWSAWLRSGGLLVLVSIGLHGLLLAMPMRDADQPEEPVTLLLPLDTATNIELVPLPDKVMRVPAGRIVASPAPEATLAAPRPQAQAELATTQTQPPTQPEPLPEANPKPTPEPLPPAETIEPEVPPGLVYNHQVKALRNDTQSFLEWYSSQNWGDDPAQMPLPGPKELAPLRIRPVLSVCLNPPRRRVG